MRKTTFFNFILQYGVYILIRCLFISYRLKIVHDPGDPERLFKNGIFYFWHQHILSGMLLFYRTGQKGACVVSPSDDGKIIGFVAQRLGFSVIYGSPHKQPIYLVRKALDVVKTDQRICLVGDGSRGPAFQVQPGLFYLARKSCQPLVFVECLSSWSYTIKRSWDQFKIPLPFSCVTIIVHPPVRVTSSDVST